MEINVAKKRIFFARNPNEVAVRGVLKKMSTQDQSVNVKVSSQLVAMTGGIATVTVAGARLAKKFILGITCRVTTIVAGAALTTLNIGDGTDADRYGAAIAIAAGTEVNYSNATADPREWLTAAGDIVFTAVAGVITSGEVRLDIHYLDLDAPNS